jgi:hypothetical protein
VSSIVVYAEDIGICSIEDKDFECPIVPGTDVSSTFPISTDFPLCIPVQDAFVEVNAFAKGAK